MHTNDVLTGRRLNVRVELETLFTLDDMRRITTRYQAPQAKTTCACERVTFSDTADVVVQWSIRMLMTADAKMSLFQPNCRIENYISRCFAATASQTRQRNACHNTTQQALSTHQYSSISTLSIPDLDKKSKK